jgi:hypothetical protein
MPRYKWSNKHNRLFKHNPSSSDYIAKGHGSFADIQARASIEKDNPFLKDAWYAYHYKEGAPRNWVVIIKKNNKWFVQYIIMDCDRNRVSLKQYRFKTKADAIFFYRCCYMNSLPIQLTP